MKTMMVLAVAGLIATAINASPFGGPEGPGGQGQVNPGGPMNPPPAPDQKGLDLLGEIQDKIKSVFEGDSPFGDFGGFFGDDRREKFGCVCRNQCRRNTDGTKNVACSSSRAEYFQCVGTTCANQTCPAQQLFNQTSGSCESCAKGFHVDAIKRRCVCDRETRFDFKTRACAKCPTDAVINDDNCYCSNNTVEHRASNACKTCPTGAKQVEKQCVCTDKKQFWNENNFACQSCPGAWVNETIVVNRGFRSKKEVIIELCQCAGEREVFNQFNVTCVTCPENSTVQKKLGVAYCVCDTVGQRYDFRTNTCVDGTSFFGIH